MKTLEEHESKEVQDAEAVLSDAEILINEELRKGGVDEERARRIVEERIEGVVSTLRMNSEEENEVRRAALEGLSIPFEFERTGRRRVIEKWEGRQKEERAAKLAKTESFLKQYWAVVDDAVERVISLDQMLAMASLMEKYTLTIPAIGNEGIAFVNGRNLFLMKDQLEGGSRARPARQLRTGQDEVDEDSCGQAQERRHAHGSEQRGKDDPPHDPRLRSTSSRSSACQFPAKGLRLPRFPSTYSGGG